MTAVLIRHRVEYFVWNIFVKVSFSSTYSDFWWHAFGLKTKNQQPMIVLFVLNILTITKERKWNQLHVGYSKTPIELHILTKYCPLPWIFAYRPKPRFFEPFSFWFVFVCLMLTLLIKFNEVRNKSDRPESGLD